MESNERAELERLLFGLAARIDLPAREKRAMLADFRAAAEYLVSDGVPAREAAERLGCERLGDFYLRRADYWYPLDDAAKIYPMSMTDGWMSVFRLSAYMDAPVVPELLQAALHFVLPRFPFFSTEVRRGLFWHYIDGVKRRFVVRPETEPPCAPMDLTAGERQAFRVVYYRERISVEFFHILTDGTGGLAFLTALVSEYLRLLGLSDGQDAPAETPPDGEECENAFERCCGEAPCGGFAERPAVQLRGTALKAAARAGAAPGARHLGAAWGCKGARRDGHGAGAGLHRGGSARGVRALAGGDTDTGARQHAQVPPLGNAAQLLDVLLRRRALGGSERRGAPYGRICASAEG